MARHGEHFHSRADEWAIPSEEHLRSMVQERDRRLQDAQVHIADLRLELKRLGERIDALEVMMLGEKEN